MGNLEPGTWNWRSPDPYQYSSVLIDRHSFGLDEFFLEGRQMFVREVKFYLEHPI
jgi:hypothetical protein